MKHSKSFDKKMAAIRTELLQLSKEVSAWHKHLQKLDRQVKRQRDAFQKRYQINKRKFYSLIKSDKKTTRKGKLA